LRGDILTFRLMMRRILASFGYLADAALIIGGTIGLVAYGEGYEFSFKLHHFILKGLVLINSSPGSAAIARNGTDLKKHTNYRATYSPGSYTFTVSKDGFRSWSKRLTVEAGQVTDARYIVLLPNTLVKATVATTSSFGLMTTSADERRVAYVTPASATIGQAIWTIDLPSGQPIRRFNLPLATPDVPTETINQLTWSKDGSHILFSTQSSTGKIFRVMENNGNNIVNLTTKYQLDFSNIVFAPSDWHLLFWMSSDGTLRRLDLGAESVSGVIAGDITQISFANDRILFIQTTSLGKTLQSAPVSDPTNISRLIPSLPESPTYAISFGRYQNSDELVIIPASTREATLYSGIFGSSPVSTIVARNVDAALFSPSDRYIALYSATHVSTYDGLLSSATHIVTSESPALPGALTSLMWADDAHLISRIGSSAVWSDYDGSNAQVLTSDTADGSVPFASNDQRSAYVISAAPTVGDQTLSSLLLRP
jgi:hypothetical protein